MKQTDLAYLAGIIDGEGCFSGHLKNKHHSTGGDVGLRVIIGVTSLVMIDKVKETYDQIGLSYGLQLGLMKRLSTRPAHFITVHRKADVKLLIETLLPYLLVKKPEAEIMLKWLKKWGDMRGNNKSHKIKVPSPTERAEVVAILKQLKKVA